MSVPLRLASFEEHFAELAEIRSAFTMAEMTDEILSVASWSRPNAAIVSLLGADRNMAIAGANRFHEKDDQDLYAANVMEV